MMPSAVPQDLPPELIADAFISGSEAAWPLESAIRVVEWLRQNGIAVLGTELWVVREDGIQPGIYVDGMREIHGNAVSAKHNETWSVYVDRTAEETLRYLGSFETPPEANKQGGVYFNIVWISESEYPSLGKDL